jgi:hypothetical protein
VAKKGTAPSVDAIRRVIIANTSGGRLIQKGSYVGKLQHAYEKARAASTSTAPTKPSSSR